MREKIVEQIDEIENTANRAIDQLKEVERLMEKDAYSYAATELSSAVETLEDLAKELY